MSSTSEVGFAKLLAHFDELINTCTGYGTAYNPSLPAIGLANLNNIKTAAAAATGATTSAFTQYKVTTNAREAIFEPVKALSTRLVNALIASGASDETVKDARSLQRKINGTRAKALPKKQPATTTQRVVNPGDTVNLPVDPTPISISVSQVSYDGVVDNFSKLHDLLSSVPSYAPNEADLQVASLNSLLAQMKSSNAAVIAAANALSNSRIARNAALYQPVTGLVTLAKEVKAYVKSLFGARSAQYKQLSKLKFS